MSGYEWRSGFDRDSRAPVDEKWSRWEHRLELDGLSSRHESEPSNEDMDDLRIKIQQLSKRLHEIQDKPRDARDEPKEYYRTQGREEDLRYTRLGHQKDDDSWKHRHGNNDEGYRHSHEMRRGGSPMEFINHKSGDLRDWLDPRHSNGERKYCATNDYKNMERERNPKETHQRSDRHYQDLRSGPEDYSKTPHLWGEDRSDLREGLKRGRNQADGYKSSSQPTSSAHKDVHSGKSLDARYPTEEFKSSSLVSHMHQDDRREPPSRDKYQYEDYSNSILAKTARRDDRPELSESGGRQINDNRTSSQGGSVREVHQTELSLRSNNSLHEERTSIAEVPIHQEPKCQTVPNLFEGHQGLTGDQFQDLIVSDKKPFIKNPFHHISDPLLTTLSQNRIENLNRLKSLIDEESRLMKHNSSPEASLVTMKAGEVLLPKDQPAEIESFLDLSRDNDAIGLEYIVEIHHNTVKYVDHSYHCLLCNVPIKSGKVDRIIYPVVLAHVKTIGHKINYMGKHFPKKKQEFQALNGLIAKDDLTCFIEKVIEKFGRKKVKTVEGMKLFKQDILRIKKDAETSEHHTEDVCKIQHLTHKSNIADLLPLPILDLPQDSSNPMVLSQEQQMLDSRPPGEVFNDWYEAQRVLGLTLTPEEPLGLDTHNSHRVAEMANNECYNRSLTIDIKPVSHLERSYNELSPTQARNREIEIRRRLEVTDEHQIGQKSRSIDKIDSGQRLSTNKNKSKEKSGSPTKASRVKERLGSGNRDRKDGENRGRRSRSRKRSRSLRRSCSPVHRPSTRRRFNSPSPKPSSSRPEHSRSPRRHRSRSRSPKIVSSRRELSRSPRLSSRGRRRSRSPRPSTSSGGRSRSPRLTSKITRQSRSPRPSSSNRRRSRSPRPSSSNRRRSGSPRPSSSNRERSRSPRPSATNRGRSRSPRSCPRIKDRLGRRSKSRDDWLFSLMSSTSSAIQSVSTDYPVSYPPAYQSLKIGTSPLELSEKYAKDNVSLSRDIPREGTTTQDNYVHEKSAEKFSSSKPDNAFDFLENLLSHKSPEKSNQPYLAKNPEVLRVDERLLKVVDKKVNEFLIQEKELLTTLKPKRRQLVEPNEDDPEYHNEWLKFYKMKRAYKPDQDNLCVVEKQWKSEWKCIQAFRLGKNFTESRDSLLSKHQLSQDEIDQSQKRRERENPFDKPPNFWDKYLSNNYVLKLKSNRDVLTTGQPLVSQRQKEQEQDQVLFRENAFVSEPKKTARVNQPNQESIPTNSSKSQSQVAVEQSAKRNLEDGVMKFEDVELDYGRIFRWGTQGTWNNLKSVLDELLNADISITVMAIESSPHKMLLKKIISRLDELHEPHHPITSLTSQQIKDSIHSLYYEEEDLSSGYSSMSALYQRWNGFNFNFN